MTCSNTVCLMSGYRLRYLSNFPKLLRLPQTTEGKFSKKRVQDFIKFDKFNPQQAESWSDLRHLSFLYMSLSSMFSTSPPLA